MYEYDWEAGLPKEYHSATVPPAALEKFEDEALSARRIKGFDTHGKLSYYYHTYVINRERFDEEGLFEESEAYRQEVTAWRLYTSVWLVRKYEAGALCDCASRLVKPSYTISESCPA